MAFYDEPPELLIECVASYEGTIDRLIALDGAYALFPGGRAQSPAAQHHALQVACDEAGVLLDLHVPPTTWAGGEIEKRTTLFDLGVEAATSGDWFFIIDADQILERQPASLRERLEAADCDVAHVTFADHTGEFPVRVMFRAQRIRLVGNHYTYVAEDGRVLWSDRGQVPDLLDLSDGRIRHRTRARPVSRLVAKEQYYRARTQAGVELHDCYTPGCTRKATQVVPGPWRFSRSGEIVTDWIDACDLHARLMAERNRKWMRRKKIDPRSARVNQVGGRAPA